MTRISRVLSIEALVQLFMSGRLVDELAISVLAVELQTTPEDLCRCRDEAARAEYPRPQQEVCCGTSLTAEGFCGNGFNHPSPETVLVMQEMAIEV